MMHTEETTLSIIDQAPRTTNVLEEVIFGLSQAQKSLPAKLLYDKRGSEIFEDICCLPSYYPTRTETRILTENAAEMVKLMGDDALIIEPGSGAAEKVRILLRQMKGTKRYVPVEISREILLRTCSELMDEFPEISLSPVCADFTQMFELPLSVKQQRGRKVVFFPGSTIGNLHPSEAKEFLMTCARLTGPGGGLLIGADRKKDPDLLHLAYNDPEGVTAAFNLNLLDRLNREADASFVKGNFAHEAIYNFEKGRIEMHLRSLLPQLVRVNRTVFRFREGETIHTENSYKYSVGEFLELGLQAGLKPVRYWQDQRGLFSVYYFENK